MLHFKNGLVLATFLTTTLFVACTSDQLPEPISLACADDTVTYDNQIKPILDTYCSLSSNCHASGSSFGDYTNYASMQNILNESGFQNRVVDTPAGESSKMPPPYTDGPLEIEPADFELIQCWINQNYTEN